MARKKQTAKRLGNRGAKVAKKAAAARPGRIALAAFSSSAAGGAAQTNLQVKRYALDVTQKRLNGGVEQPDSFTLNVVAENDPAESLYALIAVPVASGQPVVKQFWDTVEGQNWQTGWHFDADSSRNITKIYP